MTVAHDPVRAPIPSLDSIDLQWGEIRADTPVPCRSFRFTIGRFDDGPATIYGIYACPDTPGPRPGILHIHGGGQTVKPEDLAFWCARGYAAMSFDWTGPTADRADAEVAHYPFAVAAAPVETMAAARTGRSRLLLACRAARVCLHLLAAQDDVDAAHTGFYGISWGGFISWLVNGTESIQRAACSIYGTGGIHLPGHCHSQLFSALPSDDRALWLRSFDPPAHVQAQQAPMLHLNSSNDFFGGVDVLADMLPRLPVDWRFDCTPNGDHHIELESRQALQAWFDHYLRGAAAPPKTPDLRVQRVDGNTVTVSADGAADGLELWSSDGELCHNDRCWSCHTDWQAAADGVQTTITAGGDLWLYLRRRGKPGEASVCSAPQCLALPAAAPADTVTLYAPGQRRGIGFYMAPDISHAAEPDAFFHQDHDGLHGRAPGAPLVSLTLRTPAASPAGQRARALVIEVEDVESLTVVYRTARREGNGLASFSCCPGPGRQRVLARAEDFRSDADQGLSAFGHVVELRFSAQPVDGTTWRLRAVAWQA
jgi:dienelactone hydrolase